HFDAQPERFVLSCSQLSNGHGAQLTVELHDTHGALLYRGRASMAPRDAASTAPAPSPNPTLDDWGGAAIYGDVLFHSDAFQVIRELHGVGPEGIDGTLAGVHEAGWVWERWLTDVAALDGGLQLVLLWARDQLGGAALPMGIKDLRLHGALPEGPVRCIARCGAKGSQRGTADIAFLDADGRRFAELRGVELILRPDVAAPAARA
ncbi:MAG: polyketide synthase dehydratase domain-containing protein, partial [Deltaproteobacteria bacterium]|nr:polyketide synthase dehydratase domain-containing protein [Deltaproteobacteria bacterium]